MLERIAFLVAGRVLAHTDCRLVASAEDAVREASFSIAWAGAGLPCQQDDEAQILVSSELWGTGYVRDVLPSHDANSRRYSVTFVSRTIDATECSIVHPTGLKRDGDLKAIAQEFDTLDIGVEGESIGEAKPVHKVRPGESLFDTLETDARAQGVLIYDTEEGRLKLAAKPEGRHGGGLTRAVNILSASGRLSGRHSFSKLTVRGQASEGVSGSSLRPEASAKGTSQRNRPLIRIYEGEASSSRLKKRASWEARRAAGEGASCTIVTPGWRDGTGRLWTRNYLVAVSDDWIGIEQDMVIASVSLEQDQGGTRASLMLKDPRSLGGDNPRGKSSAGWSAPVNSEPEYRDE